jgi:hypothetical protein
VQAQSKPGSVLRGQVNDQAGGAVKGAKVALMDDKKEVAVENTDLQGHFVFNGLPDGQYHISVEATGFTNYRGEVRVGEMADDLFKITLKAGHRGSSIEAGENANAAVLRGNVIRRLPQNQEQLAQVLQRMGGAMANGIELSVNGVKGGKMPPTTAIVAYSGSSNVFIFRGQIVDPAGAGVTAAKVTLTDAGKSVRVVTSDKEGHFVFENVTTGSHDIVVAADSFATYEEKVSIPAASVDGFKIRLEVAALKSEVEVRAGHRGLSIEADENANAVVLRGDVIKRLPQNQEQLEQVLQRMAGALANAIELSVNGVKGGKMPPTATIKEIRINSNPFAAAYHDPGSVRIEIETKGGEDRKQGGLFFTYRNSALDARNAFSLDKPPLEYRDFGGYWSSKLFGPRSFIFGYFERRAHDEANIISANLANGLFAGSVPALGRNSLLDLRADFRPSDRHVISLLYDLNHNRGQGQGVTNIDLPERAYGSRATEQTWQVSVRSILSPKVVNEALLKFGREHKDSAANIGAAAIEVAGAFNSGGAQCCPERSANQRFSFADNLSFSAGRHLIKTGVSVEGVRVNDYSERNFGGTFLFSGLTSYRLNNPILFTVNTGDPRLKFSQWKFAAYAQDDIKLWQNFTLSPGLRYETQTHLEGYNNFAPRLGFAWSPFKSRSTVIRGGAGVFYQQLGEAQFGEALRYDGIHQRQLIIQNPRFPNPFGDLSMTALPTSVYRLASDLRTPYQLNGALGVERRLPRDTIITVTYNYLRGVHLFRSRDINAPLASGLRPYPEFARITQLESSGTSTSRRLAVGLSQKLNAQVTIFANYTLARAIDDADGPDALPMDNYHVKIDRGYAAQDIRHQFYAGGLLTLPLKLEVTPMFYFNTGRPYNITTGLDNNNDMVVNDRPPGVPRNSGRGTNFTSVDLRLSRYFGFRRRSGGNDELPFGIEFAIEAANLLNQVNFADFNSIQTSPFFRRANAANDARYITIHINFNFQ